MTKRTAGVAVISLLIGYLIMPHSVYADVSAQDKTYGDIGHDFSFASNASYASFQNLGNGTFAEGSTVTGIDIPLVADPGSEIHALIWEFDGTGVQTKEYSANPAYGLAGEHIYHFDLTNPFIPEPHHCYSLLFYGQYGGTITRFGHSTDVYKAASDGCENRFASDNAAFMVQNIDLNDSRYIEYSFLIHTRPTQTCTLDCNDNVLFIPGMESSRLYERTALGENKRWEPDESQSDISHLYLDQNGNSVNQVYTKADGVIDHIQVGPLHSTNVYESFLNQLAGFAASSTIAAYKVFPYDWRMSPEDIVNNGTLYDDVLHFPENDLVSLAATSRTGKVMIVAHSNGGLVTKALMRKLEADGKANLVSKIIFVDVPQLGTPKAVASMLHGDFQDLPGDLGFLASKANARGLAENMKDAYDLLPSAEYFARVSDPVINVEQAPALRAGGALSDSLVDNAAELQQFVTGAGGRTKPAPSDIETPDVLSQSLLNGATQLHNNLDTWTPPAGVQVIQIAGWGLDTPKGITYTEEKKYFCSGLSCAPATTTKHTVDMTEDGDGTVVTPSQTSTPSAQVYYISVLTYNIDTQSHFEHVDIMETNPLQQLFVHFLATSSPVTSSQYIMTTLPTSTISDKRLRLRVLSPVSLDAYDSFGHHTGMAQNPIPSSDLLYKEEQIPNSYYEEFGEGKYLGLSGDGTFSIKLRGLDTGTFTFIIDSISGNTITNTNSYVDIPVTASTTAAITVGSNSTTALVIDENGDGTPDITIASSTQSTDVQTYIKLIKASIAGMDTGTSTKRQLNAKFSNVSNMIAKLEKWDDDDDDGRESNKNDKLIQRILKKLDKIDMYINKQLAKTKPGKPQSERISPVQAQAILNMNSYLKSLVIIKQI